MTTDNATATLPHGNLITGTVKRTHNADDIDRILEITARVDTGEAESFFWATLYFRGRTITVPLITIAERPPKLELWPFVHNLIDAAVMLEYEDDIDEVDWCDGATDAHKAAILEQAEAVKVWLGPDMFAACVAAFQAADGHGFFERFVEELCAPTWSEIDLDGDRFADALRDRGYPMPGQFWRMLPQFSTPNLVRRDGQYLVFKVEQTGATTVWLCDSSGNRQTRLVLELIDAWERVYVDPASWTASTTTTPAAQKPRICA